MFNIRQPSPSFLSSTVSLPLHAPNYINIIIPLPCLPTYLSGDSSGEGSGKREEERWKREEERWKREEERGKREEERGKREVEEGKGRPSPS